MMPFNHLGWFFNLFGSSAYPRAVVEELCDVMQPMDEGASLLDIGAGTGTLINYAYTCREDLRLVAADPAEGMLKYVPEYIEAINARAEALPFEESSFDAVLMGEAFHHFENPDDALKEITRVLKDDGMLFVYEFDPSTFLGKGLCIAENLLGEPGNFFAPEVLKTMVEGHGFSVRVSRYGWRYTLHAQLPV